MFKMNKKGAIEGLQSLIVPLIGIGIVLVVGFLIFAEAKTKMVTISDTTITTTNESVTSWINYTYKALTLDVSCMTLNCGDVYNSSGGSPLSTDSYDCIVTQGIRINNVSGSVGNSINVSYTCKPMTSAYNATSDLQNATQDIPGWLPIIVITVIGAILLGLVAQFRGRK